MPAGDIPHGGDRVGAHAVPHGGMHLLEHRGGKRLIGADTALASSPSG